MITIRFAVIFILSTHASSLFCEAQIFSSAEVETQTEDPLLACEPPWRSHGSKCFYTTASEHDGGTLPVAKQTCKRFGGDLAKPSSYDEHIFIRRILTSYNDTWIGATDNDRKNWLDGTPMLYTNFNDKDFTAATATAAPKSGQEQTAAAAALAPTSPALCPSACCGLTTNMHGKWSYFSCDTVLNFVCVKTNETVAEFRKSNARKSKTVTSDSEVANAGAAAAAGTSEAEASPEEAEDSPETEAETSEEEMESSESKVQSDAVESVQNQQIDVKPKPKTDGKPNSSRAMLGSVALVSLNALLVCSWKGF